MKVKFLQLRKVLLVAAGLLVGASVQKAQAETINATLVHTASSYSGATAGAFTSTVDAEKEHINNTKRNAAWAGCAYADFSFEIPEGQVVTSAKLTFTGVGSGKDRTTDVMYVNVGETLDYTSLSGGTADVDLGAKYISTVTFKANATANFTTDVTDALKEIVSEGQKYIIFKFTNNAGGGDLKGKGSDSAPNLVIETASASSTTSYTVNFLDVQSNVLKAPTVYTGQLVGASVTASADDMASFENEDGSKKYIYESGNETITLNAEATQNIINLVFREAEKYSYIVNATSEDGAVNQKLAEGEDFEGATLTIPYLKYINVDGTLYNASQGSSAGYYLTTLTLNANNSTATIKYSKTEITNVVYFSEGEDIEGMTTETGSNANIRCSNGAGGYAAEAVKVTTLQPGKYIVTANIWGNAGVTIVVKAGESEVLSLNTAGYLVENSSEEFVLTKATDITVEGAVAGKPLDYIYIVKTGELEETGTIAESGYSTLASAYGLDFSKAEGIEAAYLVTEITKDAVILTSVTEVPANTGVILKGDGNASYSIPVKADVTYSGKNKLYAAVTERSVEANEAYILKNGEFHLVTEKSDVPAGKAYLLAEDVPSEARSLGLQFGDDDNTTGIVEVEKANVENGTIYNLNGQRVSKPANGLYIMNGKKVIIK